MDADHQLDVGEKGCGEVTPLVRQALRELAPGEVLAVRTQVAPVGTELTAWCRMTGHEFLGTERDADTDIHFVRRRPG